MLTADAVKCAGTARACIGWPTRVGLHPASAWTVLNPQSMLPDLLRAQGTARTCTRWRSRLWMCCMWWPSCSCPALPQARRSCPSPALTASSAALPACPTLLRHGLLPSVLLRNGSRDQAPGVFGMTSAVQKQLACLPHLTHAWPATTCITSGSPFMHPVSSPACALMHRPVFESWPLLNFWGPACSWSARIAVGRLSYGDAGPHLFGVHKKLSTSTQARDNELHKCDQT